MTVQTFKVIDNRIIVLPFRPIAVANQEIRLYSLYFWNGRCWKRCRESSFKMSTAYKVWSDEVINQSNLYSIRRIKIESLRAQ